ncbi:MAG: hypothetical protein IT562_10820 [Alphaproteobacteria bacterium]|nr:hypothetical protein [Alphaproteobacteria bacterium]
MIRIIDDQAAEPQYWTLVFNRTTTHRWARMLACGRYKHVSAYAFLPAFRQWLFFDVHPHRTQIIVASDGRAALALIAERSQDADLMRIRVQNGRSVLGGRVGFYCVPAVKHLIGLRSGALRPDALWRDCLKAGGEPAQDFHGTDVQPAAA